MFKNNLFSAKAFSLKWTYEGWACCKCGEANQKEICWKCDHTRCSICLDGW